MRPMNHVRVWTVAAILVGCFGVSVLSAVAQAARGTVEGREPAIAATPEELANLKAAATGGGDAAEVLRGKVKQADTIVAAPMILPAGGSQGKHRYVCSACEVRLTTVDDTHHKCSKCGTVYSGEPYDNYIYQKQHRQNFKNLMPLAMAWRLTGRAAYANTARKMLLGYAERYAQYPYHHGLERYSLAIPGGGHVFSETLTEAMVFAKEIAPAFDLIRASDSFSADDIKKIEHGFFRPLLKNIDRHKMAKSNWQTWHNAALFAGGALMGDQGMMTRSVSDPKHGFDYQMTASISSEGCWYENSWAYHYYALSGLIRHAEFARRAGVDLWSREPLRKMTLLPYTYTMPNGALPRFGDDPGVLPSLQPIEAEGAWRALGAPELAASLPQVLCWESIMFGRDPRRAVSTDKKQKSTMAKDAGYAILRTNGPGKLAAAFTAAPHGPHGHFDKLSFTLFGYGKELGVDPGRGGGYTWPIHLNWYKATLSHNAVTVNGRSQVPTKGVFRLFGSNDDFAAVQAVCYAAYPGIRHTRSLVLADRYLVVVDELKGQDTVRFDWNYHNTGEGVTCPSASKKGGADPLAEKYVKNVRTGSTADVIKAKFAGEEVSTQLMLASSADGCSVLTGLGPGPEDSEIPFIRVGCTGSAVVFATVIEPVQGRNAGVVRGLVLETSDKDTRVRLNVGSTEDTVRLTPTSITLSRDGKDVLSVSR
ncbi:MAG: alginate lyase family protein [Lentisphaerae bacterium]|nr:alginate lyase family protein [Lentisphaerota bacterium]